MTMFARKTAMGLGLATALATSLSTTTAFAEDSVDCTPKAYLMALRYQQQSAEIEALQMQTYQLATTRLQAMLSEHQGESNLALITDLDETVIDNSALLARDVVNCHDFSGWDTWKHWEREGDPTLIPGAKAFLEFAASQGVTIFYVSDRYDENKSSTINTLKSLALPQVNEEQVKLLGPSKTERRASVEKDYTLLMQLGDTLTDFTGEFHHAPLDKQHELVKEFKQRFGKDWIVFPNASYGHWDEAELKAWDAPIEVE